MRLNRILFCSGSLLLVGLTACQQDSTTAPAESASVAFGKNSPKYVISFSSAKAGDVGAAIVRSGGQVRRLSKGAGVATATSADPTFADRLRTAPGINSVTEDTVVQWIDPTERRLRADPAMAASRAPGSASIGDDEGFFGFQWAPKSIHAPGAWDQGARGTGVRVAVLDGGLNNNHRELDANVDVAHSASMVDGLAFNFEVDPDGFSHATHVAGIVAAEDNVGTASGGPFNGTIGIAPSATIVGVKVLHQGSGPFGDVIDGIIYAATPIADGGAGAHVINMSLGATFPSGRDIKVRTLKGVMDQATTFAHQQGAVIIASAGNGDKHGRGIDHDLGEHFTLPAQAAHVLGVSATGPEGFAFGATNFTRLASYSNFGTRLVDLSGPGGDFTLFPNPSFVFDMVLSPGTIFPATSGYFFAAGTSMAAPAVAGVAALIWEKNGLTRSLAAANAVEAKLRSSSDDLGPVGVDKAYGSGFVNADEAVQ